VKKGWLVYLLIIFIAGLMQVPTLESAGVDDVNVLDGMKEFLTNPFSDASPIVSILFYIFVLSPMILTIGLIVANTVTGR